MSESERQIADVPGQFLQVVKNGRTLDDVGWTQGRILLSTKRLVLVSEQGKRTLSLSSFEGVGTRHDVNQDIARVSDYLALEFDDKDVLLLAPDGHDAFERDVYTALLDQEIVFTRHPAVEGGVVQDTEWEKARIKIDEATVNVATASGTFVEVDLDDIGDVETGRRMVQDEVRDVVEIEHSVEGTSLETYFSGTDRHCSFLRSLFSNGQEQNQAELDLTRAEQEVLMALYAGVSPFDIPEFTGMSVEAVEQTFARLVAAGVLDEVRKRREVALTTRGRNLANRSIDRE